ncbi:MAG: hypothetical protein HC877_20710 [Thioploca sp.]|nr:hypothetical protein [Thioploca sp.]
MAVEAILQGSVIVKESSQGTRVAWASTHAFGHDTLTIQPDRGYEDIKELVGSAAYQGRIRKKLSGKWSLESNVRCPSALGSGPALKEILAAAYGIETLTPATDAVYTFLTSTGTITTLQLGIFIREQYYLQANKAVVSKFSWDMSEDNYIKFKAEGEFADFSFIAGRPTLAQNSAAGDTTLDITPADINKIFVGNAGLLVGFSGGNDNTDAGYAITALNKATNIATIAAIAGTTVNAGEYIYGFVPPTLTYPTGEIIEGLNSSLQINTVAVNCIMASIEVDTGITLLNKEATTDRPTIPARTKRRETKGKLSFYLDNPNAHMFGAGMENDDYALIIRMGDNVSLRRVTHELPAVQIKFPNDFNLGQENVTEFQVEFMAKPSTIGGIDDLTTTFD